MKNLDKLAVSNDVRRAIANTAAAYAANLHVRTDIVEIGDSHIIVRIEQFAKVTDQVYDQKDLNRLAHEIFSHLPTGLYQVRVRPLVFTGAGIDAVSASWVKEQMNAHGIAPAELAEQLHVDRSTISKLLNNALGFGRWHKAAMWYFFQSLSK